MTRFEIYSLILCLIVFILLVGVFSYMLTIIIKQGLKHIKAGLEDEDILKEFNSDGKKVQNKFSKAFNLFLNGLFCIVFGAFFISSLYINCTQNVYFENVPTYRIVLTSSMEEKNSKNSYLFDNNLNNQISAFDLIATYKIPKEQDLKLYDIVLYEVDGIWVIHRIVGIEEPNQYHPNERHFLLQGDAVGSPDRFPVLYSQMKGIYKGEKIPFIGSFILFMQSPAGWMCILLVVVSIIALPILEKKIEKAKKQRLAFLYPAKELETETVITQDEKVSIFEMKAKESDKTFTDKLEENPIAKNRYIDISELLHRVHGVRIIESKKARTYKSGNTSLAKFAVKGKTLNAYISLAPQEYQNTKYIFTDVSNVKKYANYPMRVKVSSDRQQRWVKELLIEKINKEKLTLLEMPKVVEKTSVFASLKNKKASKSFKQKLKLSPVAKVRFNDIKKELENISNVRVIESKNNITYKVKRLAVVKFAIKGKTLNAYINLNPSQYKDTKYIFTDVSNVKKYANYPMRVKVSSERQVKWVKELISQVLTKGDR